MSETNTLSQDAAGGLRDTSEEVNKISKDNGRSASILRVKLHETIDKCLGGINPSMLKEYYKSIDKKYPFVLSEVDCQLKGQLHSALEKAIEEICKEQNIMELLNSLDDIVEKEIPCSQPSWRPSGNPREDIRDHVHRMKLQHKESLESILYKLNNENLKMTERVRTKHDSILKKQADNESIIKEIENMTAIARSEEIRLLQCKLHDHISRRALANGITD